MSFQSDTFQTDAFQQAGAVAARAGVYPGNLLPYIALPADVRRNGVAVSDRGQFFLDVSDEAKTAAAVSSGATTSVIPGDFDGTS